LLNEDSAVPGLNRKTAYFQDIYLPPLHKQKEIASILSCLDAKIDLLHQQNKTLESIAQTLFYQRFIKEAEEKWESKSLSEIAEFINGLVCQKYRPSIEQAKLPVLKIKDLKNNQLSLNEWVSSNVKDHFIVQTGDIVFSWSASLMIKIWIGEKCVLNQHLFKVITRNFPNWFVYEWCKYHLDNFQIIANSHKTTMGHIKRSDLNNTTVLVPNKVFLDNMNLLMNPLFSKIVSNAKMLQKLGKLRDLVLSEIIKNGNP